MQERLHDALNKAFAILFGLLETGLDCFAVLEGTLLDSLKESCFCTLIYFNHIIL